MARTRSGNTRKEKTYRSRGKGGKAWKRVLVQDEVREVLEQGPFKVTAIMAPNGLMQFWFSVKGAEWGRMVNVTMGQSYQNDGKQSIAVHYTDNDCEDRKVLEVEGE